MICSTLGSHENFNIFGGLYITLSNICDGDFIAKIASHLVYSQKKALSQMLAWVLNTSLLLEDSSKVLLLYYIMRLLQSDRSFTCRDLGCNNMEV